jgi:alpha-L-fucosidase
LWQQAAKSYQLPFGLTEHLSASFSWWRVNKGCDSYGPYAGVPYDGNDPAWRDFYHDNGEHGVENPHLAEPWFTANPQFHAYWVRVMKELIDLFTPDMLYTDGSLPFGTHWIEPVAGKLDPKSYQPGLEVASYLYNTSIDKYGKNRAIYTQKDKNLHVYQVGILDIERSQLPDIAEEPWQTDTCIGGWFYDVRTSYKTAQHVAELLVDIISKNGTLLLNVLQKPDGTIDDEARYMLQQMADWFSVCAEGVYGTRPWKRAGEGSSQVVIDGFREDRAAWNETDFRFTCKGKTVYAFMMGEPKDHVALIRSFNEGECVRNVRLLGVGNVKFSHNFGALTVELPENLPASFANCLAIELA